MANESRVFRLPAGMSTQVVANAVEAFLSSAKGMEVQSAETTEGYVVQGRQEKDGWKTIAGMRMARRRHPSISQQLVRGVKPGEVAHFSKNHSSHTEAHAGDGGNGRMELIHNGLDLFFDFHDFSIQFTDETDGVL